MALPNHIKKAIDVYVPPLGDWLTIDRAYQMAELIIETKPEVVVELGTFKGQSLITQAFAIRDNNKGKIYGVDPWKTEFAAEGENDPENTEWWAKKIDLNQIHQDCMKAIWDHHLDPWVVIIRAASQHCFELWPGNIDIIYIDSNHSEVASVRDVTNYLPRVKQGGYIWMDDVAWATMQRAVGMVDAACDLITDGGNSRLYRKR